MYRAYKRTEIASYVRYTCFKVAVNFSGSGVPRKYTVLQYQETLCVYTPSDFSALTEAKKPGNDTEIQQ